MQPLKPHSINQLMQRVNNIAGLTLGQLAQQYHFKTPDDLLREKGWTLSAISDELGVDRETAYGWISRAHSPSNTKLVNLALDELLKRNRIPKKKRYKSVQ